MCFFIFISCFCCETAKENFSLSPRNVCGKVNDLDVKKEFEHCLNWSMANNRVFWFLVSIFFSTKMKAHWNTYISKWLIQLWWLTIKVFARVKKDHFSTFWITELFATLSLFALYSGWTEKTTKFVVESMHSLEAY